MRKWFRKFWPILKWVLAAAILIAIGRVFYRDLQYRDAEGRALWEQPMHFGWLALSGALYILGLGCFSLYWRRLLFRLGQHLTLAGAVRGYFLALLGKYLPGKIGALVMRAEIAGAAGVCRGIGYMTSFYEVLTTMTAGALLGAILFAIFGPEPTHPFDPGVLRDILRMERPESIHLGRWALSLLSLGLMASVGWSVVPALFNRWWHHATTPFRDADAAPAPALENSMLLEGLAFGACGWALMGLSLGAAVQGVLQESPLWDVPFLARMMAIMGTGYVAGFVIIFMPSGLAVREYFLTLLLVPELRNRFEFGPADAAARAVLAVLLLRLSWTIAEVITAGIVYWLPMARPLEQTAESGEPTSP